MKKKIGDFARGKFNYESLDIQLEKISCKIRAGEKHTGSFVVSNNKGSKTKGIVYSSHRNLIIEEPTFYDKENSISYIIDGSRLVAGSHITGGITVISDSGEASMPFNIEVEESLSTESNEIHDLNEFTDLAKRDWELARDLFKAERFSKSLIKNKGYEDIYSHLINGGNTSQAMEEFLIATKRKEPVLLKVDKNELLYTMDDEKVLVKFNLYKNLWGYLPIAISSEGKFIKLQRKKIWADNFIRKEYPVAYVLDPKAMIKGKNFGKIHIKTPYEKITINITCINQLQELKKNNLSIKEKQASMEFTKFYLEFRMDKIDLDGYIGKMERFIREYKHCISQENLKLIEMYLMIIANKTYDSNDFHNKFDHLAKLTIEGRPQEHAGYLYLHALYKQTEDEIEESRVKIDLLYRQSEKDWRILWYLLYINDSYQKNPERKMAVLKNNFKEGCHSPIIYLEALLYYNNNPENLRQLGSFENQILNFGEKYNYLNKELREQFYYVSLKEKVFNFLAFDSLEKLYQTYNEEKALTALCSMGIKGGKRTSKYFKYYQEGVQAQLRITELYEYYMYSKDDIQDKLLPIPVLNYFVYNSNLNYRKKAYLYANVIQFGQDYREIFKNYRKTGEIFTYEQLKGHRIDENMATLYNYYIKEDEIDNQKAIDLSYVIFNHKITCENPNIKEVLVIHREYEARQKVALIDGKGYINIYTDSAKIYLIDGSGNKFLDSIPYKLKKMIKYEDYIFRLSQLSNNHMINLHLLKNIKLNIKLTQSEMIKLKQKVLETKGVNKEMRNSCLYDLILEKRVSLEESYFDELDFGELTKEIRNSILEYMIKMQYDDLVILEFKKDGFDEIDVKSLREIISRTLETITFECDDLILEMCHYLLLKGQSIKRTIKYLLTFYQGSTDAMYRIWEEGKALELTDERFEERLLAQMLFVQDDSKNNDKVFLSYYKIGKNTVLIRAFLTYTGFKYLLYDGNDQCELSSEVFEILKEEFNYANNDIYRLSYLKYMSKAETLLEKEEEQIDYHINRFWEKGMVFPFFKDFNKTISLPGDLADKSYIQYSSVDNSEVFIHYRKINNTVDNEFRTEQMKSPIWGIYIKEITLFIHDEVEYYITKELNGGVQKTETFNLAFGGYMGDEGTGYNLINKGKKAWKEGNEAELLEIIEKRTENDYLLNHYIKPIK